MAPSEQRVIPMLSYEDVGRAAEWITQAFGFEERERFADDDGTVTHVTLTLEGGTVFLGYPSPHYRGPKRHAEECEAARRWRETPYVVDGVMVFVADVDGHFERARAAGATVLSEPEDNPAIGERRYRVEDLEGHRWMFVQAI
jgi:PhnB protein